MECAGSFLFFSRCRQKCAGFRERFAHGLKTIQQVLFQFSATVNTVQYAGISPQHTLPYNLTSIVYPAVMSSPNVVQMLERYKPYASHNGMCSAPYDRHTNFERHMGTHNEPSPRYTNINAPSVRRGRCGDIGWNHKLGEHEYVVHAYACL
mmetsp:Transcript_10925/g.27694  ORF Transcript_10925/g.27694 Transcript_10925/m.27694 type:complete len:151 (-) Transcript_10925:303-755(-)